MLVCHRGLVELERQAPIWHKLHGLVDRIEPNGIVEEQEIRLIPGVPLHLMDQRSLLFPIHRAKDLLIEPAQFWGLMDPIVRTVEREAVVDLQRGKILEISPRRQGDIPCLVLGQLIE